MLAQGYWDLCACFEALQIGYMRVPSCRHLLASNERMQLLSHYLTLLEEQAALEYLNVDRGCTGNPSVTVNQSNTGNTRVGSVGVADRLARAEVTGRLKSNLELSSLKGPSHKHPSRGRVNWDLQDTQHACLRAACYYTRGLAMLVVHDNAAVLQQQPALRTELVRGLFAPSIIGIMKELRAGASWARVPCSFDLFHVGAGWFLRHLATIDPHARDEWLRTRFGTVLQSYRQSDAT
jgi:hypothetical protein